VPVVGLTRNRGIEIYAYIALLLNDNG
jgi:hypothetical protein